MKASPFLLFDGNCAEAMTSAVSLTADGIGELKPVLDKLAEGAGKDWFQDLHQMPFGWYGQFFDRYGVQWIFRAAQ